MLAEDVRHSNAANTAQNFFLYGLVTIEKLKPNFSHLLLVLVPCDTDDPVVAATSDITKAIVGTVWNLGRVMFAKGILEIGIRDTMPAGGGGADGNGGVDGVANESSRQGKMNETY